MKVITIQKNFNASTYIVKLLFILFILSLLIGGCTKTPESAMKELNKLNIPYTAEQFITNAKNGNKKVVELFLRAGMNVNTVNEQGQTALMLAASNGHINTVKLLIKHGAYVDMTDKSGDTALSLAKKANHMDIVALIKKTEINKSY